MNRNDALVKATAYLEALREKASLLLSEREAKLRKAFPEIDNLLRERALLPVRSLKLVISAPGSAKSISSEMKNEGIRINKAIRDALVKNGYPENYLKAVCACPVCRDTGYLDGSVPPQMCDCMRRLIMGYMNENTSETSGGSFESFDENRIPEEPIAESLTQRALTVRIKDACEDYADSYPDTYLPGLILSGQAGLGKTFLMDSIYLRLTQRGIGAERMSSYKLLEIMRAKHLHTDNSDEDFARVLTVPVLLIDDIGTEPILRNISEEYLCVILNERMNSKRHTVITTNLTPSQISDTYSERVMSRLSDRYFWDHLKLSGKDLRRS